MGTMDTEGSAAGMVNIMNTVSLCDILASDKIKEEYLRLFTSFKGAKKKFGIALRKMTGADPAAMNFLAAVVPEEKQGNHVASTYHLNGINTDGGTQASLHFYGKLNAKQYQKAILNWGFLLLEEDLALRNQVQKILSHKNFVGAVIIYSDLPNRFDPEKGTIVSNSKMNHDFLFLALSFIDEVMYRPIKAISECLVSLAHLSYLDTVVLARRLGKYNMAYSACRECLKTIESHVRIKIKQKWNVRSLLMAIYKVFVKGMENQWKNIDIVSTFLNANTLAWDRQQEVDLAWEHEYENYREAVGAHNDLLYEDEDWGPERQRHTLRMPRDIPYRIIKNTRRKYRGRGKGRRGRGRGRSFRRNFPMKRNNYLDTPDEAPTKNGKKEVM